MFRNEEEEYCLESKGTECIQSPEMLTLAIYSKKEGDRYDRRKKVGTTRSSDIWSLGCLFFEILTGEFLYYSSNQAVFYVTVTSPTKPILTDEAIEKLSNNTYAIDFLKYILVRDQQIRPNIDNVLKRFSYIHALVVSSSNPISTFTPSITQHSTPTIPIDINLPDTIDRYLQLILFNNSPLLPQNTIIPDKVNQKLTLKHTPCLIKIMEEIYLCSTDYFAENQERLMLSGITHVISENTLLSELDLLRFTALLLDQSSTSPDEMSAVFRLAPRVMDYLREIFLFRGKVLFVEDNEVNVCSQLRKLLLRNILLFSLTYFFKCSAYETLTLINSQVLFFSIPFGCLSQIIYASAHLFKIEAHLDLHPKAQCICGCSTFVLKRSFSSSKKMPHKLCNCTQEQRQTEPSGCPSDGCAKYLRFIRKRYKLNWDALKWVVMPLNSFLIGPFSFGSISEEEKIQVVLNSEGPNKNVVTYSGEPTGGKNGSEWTTYKCRVCHMWMFAVHNVNQQIAFIMNNMIRRNRQGISAANAQLSTKIKTPVLRHFNLYELK